MPQVGESALGREIGRRLLKAGIAIVGLLLVRVVLARLPMVAHAEPLYVSSLFGNDQAVVPLVDLARTIIDTLIFAVVIFAAVDVGSSIRLSVRRLPASGRMLVLTTLIVVVALAYSSYSSVVLPLLGDETLYDWLFLILGVLPLIGLAVLVYRNLDVITDIVFHSGRHAINAVSSGRASVPLKCANCGATLPSGAKFCAGCGAAAPPEAAPPNPDFFCSACGTRNASTAVTCSNCGKGLVRAET